MEFGEQRGNGGQAAVDGQAGKTGSILRFHESHAGSAVNRVQRRLQDVEKDLQIVRITDPGAGRVTHFDGVQKVIDERRVGRDGDHGPVIIGNGNLDGLVSNEFEEHASPPIFLYDGAYAASGERSIFSI
jgi:hypothetical protein